MPSTWFTIPIMFEHSVDKLVYHSSEQGNLHSNPGSSSTKVYSGSPIGFITQKHQKPSSGTIGYIQSEGISNYAISCAHIFEGINNQPVLDFNSEKQIAYPPELSVLSNNMDVAACKLLDQVSFKATAIVSSSHDKALVQPDY
jgi:hypothetical protein